MNIDAFIKDLKDNTVPEETTTNSPTILPDGTEVYTAENGKKVRFRLQLGIYQKRWEEASKIYYDLKRGNRSNHNIDVPEKDNNTSLEDDYSAIGKYKTDTLRICPICSNTPSN